MTTVRKDRRRYRADEHPICLYCWYASETKIPKTTDEGARQQCCECGRITRAGITVERDPTKVMYPAWVYDDEPA